MFKGISQLSCMAVVLAATASMEAAVPIWLADKVQTGSHKMTAEAHGSLQEWRACRSQNSEDQCTLKYAAHFNDVLQMSNIASDHSGVCTGSAANSRQIAGVLTNISKDVYILSSSWQATISTRKGDHLVGSKVDRHWLAPGSTATICIADITFDTPEEAQAFNLSELGSFKIRWQTGFQDRS